MTVQTPRRRMPKAVVRVDAEARLANGPPRSPPTIDAAAAAPHPPHFDRNFKKRRGSGSFLKFWLVSENSVAAPLTASGAIMGS